jgi:hypothetical protein
MNRIGFFVLNIAVALYLFANGILGFSGGGSFASISGQIFRGDFANIVTIILSVIAIAGGLFLLLALFKIDIPITDLILFIFVIVWIVFIVIVDIINPLGARNVKFLPYLVQLSSHLMVLGALITATKRFK